MNFLKAASISALIYLGCIIVVDIAGALIVTVLPEPGGRRLNGHAGFGSTVLYYAVWIVAGCFAGAAYTAASLEVTKRCMLMQQYPVIFFGLALMLSVAVVYGLYALGEMNTYVSSNSENYYVPGHRYMTFTFFISLLLVSLGLSYKGRKDGIEAAKTYTGNYHNVRQLPKIKK